MTKLLLAVIVAGIALIPVSASAQAWKTEGVKVAPVAGTVLADTGAIGLAGNYNFSVICAASTLAIVALEQRNEANTTTLKTQLFAVPATDTVMFSPRTSLLMQDNERIRLTVFLNVVGTVQCSMFHD